MAVKERHESLRPFDQLAECFWDVTPEEGQGTRGDKDDIGRGRISMPEEDSEVLNVSLERISWQGFTTKDGFLVDDRREFTGDAKTHRFALTEQRRFVGTHSTA